MYVLGIVTNYAVLGNGRGAHVYDGLWTELLVDVYAVCAVLALLPQNVRRWVRAACAAVVYAVTLADVFCFVRFGSTLNPTMLLLAGETDGREAREFLASYVQPDVLLSGVGAVLLIAILHAAAVVAWRKGGCRRLDAARAAWLRRPWWTDVLAGTAVAVAVVWSAVLSWPNKRAMAEMFSKETVGEVEHELTKKDHAEFYLPPYRLAFSVFSNGLAAKQVDRLIAAKDAATVDSCTFRSPNIVLIIGESYNKYHSQLYGYDKATTPRQVRRRRTDRLVTFTDVVAPWNLTSFVFKNVFSMHVVGQQGDWCDYPLFPELFRKAGYHVSFITNQFLPKAKEAVYDFSGGFFLNNPELSRAQFDVRNERVHVLDEGILDDYDQLLKRGPIGYVQAKDEAENRLEGNLIIFHVMGQHVNYNARYPKKQRKWTADDYDRPDLSHKKRDILSHYDNATLYNDSIVDQILTRFEDQEAIVIYFSDHGEECFGDGFQYYGRNHSAEITPRLAHQEFDIPFWIWCSHSYAVKHPDIYQQVIQARNRRLMTDALPHLLLYLAGIHAKDYHEEYNVLSPQYDERRPRIIKNGVDYDKLMSEQHGK